MTPLLIISVYAVFKLTKLPINACSIILPGHVYHWLSSLILWSPKYKPFYTFFNNNVFYLMHMHFYDASGREIHCEGDTVSTALSFHVLLFPRHMIFSLLCKYSSTYCMYVLPQFSFCRSDNVTVFLKGLNISLPRSPACDSTHASAIMMCQNKHVIFLI